ncbi:hypothetical protein RchiOBHm_Chr3g0471341 [Rosa chinensis]|uniref:Uncharacterized protein n=1 Tax=Rosa chinensis TaxID=74649 RepID=A0A2P6RB99_ROSCH|nr:hypothetical protein RchiOBHm_Chr3g0471341 [Rosa chinensis]
MHTQNRIEEAFGEEGEEVDEWGIYKAVIGGPSHGRIRGLGDGMIPPEDEENMWTLLATLAISVRAWRVRKNLNK